MHYYCRKCLINHVGKNVLVYLAWNPYNVVNIERLLPSRVHHFICLLGTRTVCLNYLSDNLIHCRPVFSTHFKSDHSLPEPGKVTDLSFFLRFSKYFCSRIKHIFQICCLSYLFNQCKKVTLVF